MFGDWLSLGSVPPGGREVTLEDQPLWEKLLATFGIVCRIVAPIRAEVAILPQEQGILFRGRVRGTVALPCGRCAEDAIVEIDQRFDTFEPLPEEVLPVRDENETDDEFDTPDESVVRLAAHGKSVEINPAALVWQELSLALPANPLCAEACKGLCPVCGENRNMSPCSCSLEQGDPRLAKLRGLQINKK